MADRTVGSICLVFIILICLGCQQSTKIKKADLTIAEQQLYDKVKNLIKDKADPDQKDSDGSTRLIGYATKGYQGLCRMLINAGADVDAQANQTDYTALVTAARSGHADVIRVLSEAGADVNAGEEIWITPLSVAEEKGMTKTVKLLKEAGAK